jgi:hypothetical protein
MRHDDMAAGQRGRDDLRERRGDGLGAEEVARCCGSRPLMSVTPEAASTSSRAASISGGTVSASPMPSRAPSAASASVAAWNRVMTAVISCIDMGPLLVR